MSIFQEYVGINQDKFYNNEKNNELTEGDGYYVIEDFIPLDDIRKLVDDLLLIEKDQFNSDIISPDNSEFSS